jgi:hypothetical protein
VRPSTSTSEEVAIPEPGLPDARDELNAPQVVSREARKVKAAITTGMPERDRRTGPDVLIGVLQRLELLRLKLEPRRIRDSGWLEEAGVHSTKELDSISERKSTKVLTS